MSYQQQTIAQIITDEITDFTARYCRRDSIATEFGEPLVGFADAMRPEIQELPSIIDSEHLRPQDIMPDASVIISYFVPFTRELAFSNSSAEFGTASSEWARAYEELNSLFEELNRHLVEFIPTIKSGDAGEKSAGAETAFRGAVIESATIFDTTKLVSNWSHRHIAYAAGLGTFGINNMLISPKGCCGRYNSVITNIPVTAIKTGSPMKEELCMFKRNGSCHACVDNCPSGALSASGDSGEFDRTLCFAVCNMNAELYPKYFYTDHPDRDATGYQVCGKCVTGAACAFRKYGE